MLLGGRGREREKKRGIGCVCEEKMFVCTLLRLLSFFLFSFGNRRCCRGRVITLNGEPWRKTNNENQPVVRRAQDSLHRLSDILIFVDDPLEA